MMLIMPDELSKTYDPKVVEEKWYNFWEKKGFFKADALSKKPSYCISIPPPNVTGVLHMGHALVDTLQDVLIRFKRMQGFEALWVPGTDHAGISTQTVVERDQIAKTGKRRKDFSRDEFTALIWEWKCRSENRILSQLRKLGCSCDWDRLAFTLDEKRNRAVRFVFKKMFDDGLIYQGNYLVNWDPVTQTALADDEVEYEEKQTSFWHLRYPLEDGSSEIIVATTRPETLFGDTAVAVHPEDERYKAFIGKSVCLPLTNRTIPIIADSFVDPTFGTGAVKITPAHDFNDFEVGRRHNLPLLNVIAPDGKMNENAGEFAGLNIEEARFEIAKKAKELGYIIKIEQHRKNVGVSYRSKAEIEPYLSLQWYIKMAPFKQILIDAVKEGKVKIIPKDWENSYFHWIENLRDWCISRQLWWGHRIPIWYRKKNPEEMICFDGEGSPPEVKKNPDEWIQDEDVLDTWFSSALWPFSILGWPESTPDLAKFYPNNVLVTGHDILFFWVARMILMGKYVLGEFPFPETFLHGLIYGKSYWRFHSDGSIDYIKTEERLAYDLGSKIPSDVHCKWEKMSKTKGNVIDPIEIIDAYGTDAMRMALCSIATHARQIDLDHRRFEEYKNFINKIWNAARFVFLHLEDLTPEIFSKGINRDLLTLEDRWILSRLNQLIGLVERHLNQYAFDRAALDIYHFFWNEFCAYYLELVKPTLFGKIGTVNEKENTQRILCIILDQTLRLFHPMIPFITEELFSKLQEKILTNASCSEPYVAATLKALQSPACIVAPFPTVLNEGDIDIETEATFSFLDKIVHAIRNIRAEMQLPPSMITDVWILAPSQEKQLTLVKQHQNILKALVRLGNIQYENTSLPKGFSASKITEGLTVTIPLPEEMKEKEKLRLLKLQEKLIAQQNQIRIKLSNEDFMEKAPKELIEKWEKNLAQAEKELKEINQSLALYEK